MTSSETVFLVNPASAGGSTGSRWPEIARRAAELGIDGDAFLSERPEQLRTLARDAAEAGARLLVVVGGDGTVNEVVNGIASVDTTAELAVIPRGTGVDFVRTFGIPTKLDEALRVAMSGRPRTIDLGRATYRSWSGDIASSYFANVASAGMSGAIAKRVNESKSRLAKASYFFATFSVFARWQPTEVHVSVDGEERAGRMRDVVVANCRYFAAGMKICPDAEPDDGLFDTLLIGDITKADLALTLPKVYRGTHLPHPKAELLRGSVVNLDAEVPLPVELDGEQPGTTPVRFEVVPRALRLRVP
ncbi:MAG TPA: diacylglycerol kinase family protein [Gaiellaceae bacterium]|nr:diacylglycerol kinase family protein [Gaiellaceae bacterium]